MPLNGLVHQYGVVAASKALKSRVDLIGESTAIAEAKANVIAGLVFLHRRRGDDLFPWLLEVIEETEVLPAPQVVLAGRQATHWAGRLAELGVIVDPAEIEQLARNKGQCFVISGSVLIAPWHLDAIFKGYPRDAEPSLAFRKVRGRLMRTKKAREK